jgi:regulator of protease activity HflC (stomatin/prohibitin superfamily)
LLSGCAKSPESTVESFERAIAKGEITEAKSYVSAQAIGMIGDRKLSELLSHEAKRIQDCGGIKKIEVKLQGEGEIRSGTTIETFNGNCPPKTENVSLIKEDGKWKITPKK